MTQDVDFKDIERRTRRAFYEDGLVEIMMGLFLMFMGALFQSNFSIVLVYMFAIFVMIPAWRAAKRRYVFPRTGYVNLGDEEESQANVKGILWFLVIYIIFLVASFLVFSRIWGSDLGRDYFYTRFIPVVAGLCLAIGPVSMAPKYGSKRWYGFGAMVVVIGVGVALLGMETFKEALALQFTISGIVPLLVGMVMFARFLRKYPAAVEVPDDKG